MEQFILLLIGLFFWAAIGHAIWISVAALLRLMFGSRCSTCDALLKNGVCAKCQVAGPSGNVPNSSPNVQADLSAAKRLLQFARFNHWLNPDEVAGFNRQLKSLESKILGLSTTTAEAATVGEDATRTSDKLSVSSIEPLASVSGLGASVGPQQEALSLPSLSQPPVVDSPTHNALPIEVLNAQSSSVRGPTSQTQVHPLDQVFEPRLTPATSASMQPLRQRLSIDLLKSFMEQSNIRWIELISASLIVICSVGLVISLWSTLSATSRFFPSLVFLVATLAVHAAGQYTLRQWKLRSTSRGILIIGLMLIPLSVLVGLLLARRDGDTPALDLATVSALLVGTAIYGSLTVFTCKTLFLRRWWVPGVVIIVACLTIVCVHFAARWEMIHHPWLLASLLPLIVANAAAAIRLSIYSRHVAHTSAWQRAVAMLCQCLFGTGVALVFWFMQPEWRSLATVWSWIPLASIPASWLAWGWSVHEQSGQRPSALTGALPLKPQSLAVRSGLLTVAWLIGGLALVLFAVATWNAGGERWSLVGLMLLLSFQWYGHGRFVKLASTAIAGSVCGWFALALLAEVPFVDETTLALPDWLSFVRVGSLTSIGLAAVACALVTRQLANGAAFARSTLVAGSGLIALGVLLTVIASATPYGPSPYGGQWAAWLLLGYGLLVSSAAVLIANRADKRFASSSLALSWLMPVGQVLLLLAAVRLPQLSWLTQDLLQEQTPLRKSAIGLSLLAPTWAWLATALNVWSTDRQRSNVRSLTLAAVPLALLAIAFTFSRLDEWQLVSWIGWSLPLTLWGVFCCSRAAVWRELTLVASSLWFLVASLHLGSAYAWWEPLGLFASAITVLAIVVPLTLITDYLLGRFQLVSPAEPKAISSSSFPHHENWGSKLAIFAGWSTLIVSGSMCCFSQVGQCLGYEPAEPSSAWLVEGLTGTHFALALIIPILLMIWTVWKTQVVKSDELTVTIGLFPITCAMAAIAWIAPPYSLPAGLWFIGGFQVLVELLWRVVRGQNHRLIRWIKPLEVQGIAWGAIGFSALLVLSTSFVASAIAGRLPEELLSTQTNWGANLLTVSLCLAPIAVVCCSRWWWSLLSGDEAWWSAGSAILGAVCMSLGFALADPDRWGNGSYTFANMFTLFLLALTGTLATFAWLTLGVLIIRNVVGLRAIAGGNVSLPQLLNKSMRGSRYKLAESIGQRITLASLLPSILLVFLCCAAVVMFPIRALPELPWLGSGWLVAVVLWQLPLVWYFARRSGSSRSGLTAVCLGNVAPIAAAIYANWLAEYPGWQFINAMGFEPWRLMIGGWLLTLCIGLIIRAQVALSGRNFTSSSEAAWLLLATLTGILSIVGIRQDPNAHWPTAELLSLALITCLSGTFSQQVWRGHLAAGLAAAAVACELQLHLHRIDAFAYGWTLMWGTVSIGIISSLTGYGWNWMLYRRGLIGSLVTHQSRNVTVQRSTSLLAPIASIFLSFCCILFYGIAELTGLPWLGSMLGVSVAMLLLSTLRLWERGVGQRGLGVYLSVLNFSLLSATLVSRINELSTVHARLLWLTALLAGMALMAAMLRELCREASSFRHQLRLTGITDVARFRRALDWMPSFHNGISYLALIPCCLLVFSIDEQSLRVAATALPLLGAAAILPIAANRQTAWFRYSGLLFGSVSVILLAWAQLPAPLFAAEVNTTWLFLQRAFLACTVLSYVYFALARGFSNDQLWLRPIVVMSWVWCGIGSLVGSVMLSVVVLQSPGSELREFVAQLAIGEKLLIIVAWLAIAVRLLMFAVRPQLIEAEASTAIRKGAVYLTELALVGMGASVAISFPDLFAGLFLAWWPIVVLAIAMLSAGIGEWLRRMNQTILADPIQQSSLLLPIIPLAGVWWLVPVGIDWLWNDSAGYALLLLTSAAVYAAHGWARNSVGLRGLAAALTMLSFWSFLHSYPTLRFLEHPQFWLLPPAVAALGFIEWNRARLDPRMLISARYVLLLIAYLSSTSEIILRAFAGQLWQPIVLLALSLLGIGLGIALRVKAFMLCGSVFTFVALLGMVWHAQQAIGQVWPWWAFGITTGICIFIFLGYREKNRDKLNAYLQQWQQWQG